MAETIPQSQTYYEISGQRAEDPAGKDRPYFDPGCKLDPAQGEEAIKKFFAAYKKEWADRFAAMGYVYTKEPALSLVKISITVTKIA